MRLIDADLLKKSIAKWLQGGDPQETVMVKLDDIAVSVIMEIDKQPTVYDVEKVVEELEEKSDDIPIQYEDNYEKGFDDGIGYAIDIIWKGGV